MAENKNPFRNVQVSFRRSQPLTKVVVIACLVLSTAALITLRWVQSDIEAQTQDLKSQAAHMVEANADLQQKIDNVDSVQGVLDIAESELDLVNPNATFFEPQVSEAN